MEASFVMIVYRICARLLEGNKSIKFVMDMREHFFYLKKLIVRIAAKRKK